MELITIFLAAILFGAAVYLMLSRNIIRIIIGTAVLSHGAHLMFLTMGNLKRGAIPVLDENIDTYSDPLPQALILTAIVIAFALTAITLVMALRTYKELGTNDIEKLKGDPHAD